MPLAYNESYMLRGLLELPVVVTRRAAERGPMTRPAPSQIVRDFLLACAAVIWTLLSPWSREDIEYDNVPVGKVFGPDGVRSVLSGGIMAAADEVEWVVLRQVAEGDVVMSERVDRFRIGERWLEIPVVGVFELSDGKIVLWRDYFDVESYRRQQERTVGSSCIRRTAFSYCADMASRPLLLITNDDGVRSPGLRAAAEAVADLGDLLVVAPAKQQSSMSRAFVTGSLGRQRRAGRGGGRWSARRLLRGHGLAGDGGHPRPARARRTV